MPQQVSREDGQVELIDRTFLEDRIHASLATAMIGDALGAPTESRTIAEIQGRWSWPVTEFQDPPGDAPYARGRRAGQITDDSSQMLLLASAYVEGNGIATPAAVAEFLVKWSENPDYFPHFAGPSTRRAIESLRNGADPETLGAEGNESHVGTTNGSAMRVAPAGLVNVGDLEGAALAAALTCQPSHFTSSAVSAASAIAAAVAEAATPHSTILSVVRAAKQGASFGEEYGRTHGRATPGASVRSRIDLAVSIAIQSDTLEQAIHGIAESVGVGLQAAEAVPAAIGFFVAAGGDPWKTVVAAASAGDDSDTAACMGGAIAGAYGGMSKVPRAAYEFVRSANPELEVDTLIPRLAEIAYRRLSSSGELDLNHPTRTMSQTGEQSNFQ